MVCLARLMSTIYPGFVFRVFHLLLGRLPSKADEFYLPKAKATGLKAPDIRLTPVVCLQKTVLATSRPYIRLVCQEAIRCACRMQHFMEVQELIFAVHPGMTDQLRSCIHLQSFVKKASSPFSHTSAMLLHCWCHNF